MATRVEVNVVVNVGGSRLRISCIVVGAAPTATAIGVRIDGLDVILISVEAGSV